MTDSIAAFLDAEQDRQTGFLAELVKIPTDNPPGDCAAHAERARALLQDLGFEVEAHPVPEMNVRAAGMKSVTNLIVRHRFGDGPTIALNAHGDVVPPGLGWSHDPYGSAGAPPSPSLILRATPGRCWRFGVKRNRAQNMQGP